MLITQNTSSHIKHLNVITIIICLSTLHTVQLLFKKRGVLKLNKKTTKC